MIKTKTIGRGEWRTVEPFLNAKGKAFFRDPAEAQIKVRYGVGFLGTDRQKQRRNGSDYRTLSVGLASVTRARMQVYVAETTDVTYDVYYGGVAVISPEIQF